MLPTHPADPFDPISGFIALLIAERAELEAELGCPVRFCSLAEARIAPARCLVGPATLNAAFSDAGLDPASTPSVVVDRDRRLVAIDGPDIAGVGAAFQFLRTAFRSSQTVTNQVIPTTAEDAFATLATEVSETYPAFALRDLDWTDICDRHHLAVRDSDASLTSLQQWFAELQDAHTWVKDSRLNARLPYQVWIEPGEARLTTVPEWSAAWAAGVRPGDRLPDVGAEEWLSRTSATPRTLHMVAGFRWLAGMTGSRRHMRAVSAQGRVISWTETYQPLPWPEPVSWSVLSSGTGYLRIRGWLHTATWWDRIEAAFRALAGQSRLLVDLRGNVGGSLVAAMRFRDRFLTEPAVLGDVRFSIGGGQLSAPTPFGGQPPAKGGWAKPVRFLIDRTTYSASEDAILGLGGLSHVGIWGEPSGGGSGRPRTIPLRDGLFATVSTALTYDRNGHCVEANGVPVDVSLPIDEHLRDPHRLSASDVLAMADGDWPG